MRIVNVKTLGLVRVMLVTFAVTLAVMVGETSAQWSWSCGIGVDCELDNQGVLTVSGSGMPSFPKSDDNDSWKNNISKVTRLVFKNGVSNPTISTVYSTFPNLTSIRFESEDAIASNIFISTNKLTAFDIPGYHSHNSSVGGVLFDKNKTILIAYPMGKTGAAYTVPDGVKTIGRIAFWDNGYGFVYRNLASITIPESVDSIGDGAFHAAIGLVSITIMNPTPPTVRVADNSGAVTPLFNADEANRNACLYVPEGSIEAYENAPGWKELKCFKSMDDLEPIATYEDLGETPANIFAVLDRGYTLTISPTVIEEDVPAEENGEGEEPEENDVAEGSEEPEESEVPEKVKTVLGGKMKNFTYSVNGAVISQTIPWWTYRAAIERVIIEDAVTTIGNYAFYEHISLTSVSIPNSVTFIGSHAFFGNTSLTQVTIPEAVTTIGQNSFNGCAALTSVTMMNPEPPEIAPNTFTGVALADAVLWVPTEEAAAAYRAADVWKDFGEINSLAETSIRVTRRSKTSAAVPQVSVRGRTLSVRVPQAAGREASVYGVKLIDLRGKTVARFGVDKSGVGTHTLKKVPAGSYVVEVRAGAKRLSSSKIIVR